MWKNKEAIKNFIPVLLTLGNLGFGFAVIWLALTQRNRFWEDPANFFTLLAALLMISCICDFLDGFVARKLHVTSSLGLELDSLADLVSFGVAPVVVFYVSFFDAKPTIFSFAACLWYILAGAFRLARFNDSSHKKAASGAHFDGLPITGASMLWVAALFFLGQRRGNFLYEDYEGWVRAAVIFLFASVGVLMVSHFPYKSLKKGVRMPRKALRDLVLLVALSLFTLFRFGPETLVLAVPLFYIFGTPLASISQKLREMKQGKKTTDSEQEEENGTAT